MKKLDAFRLKLIAVIAMTINHIGHVFEPIWQFPLWQFIYLGIGLLTFPIMAYLMVEGFYYTRNRMNYAMRLGFFSLLSFTPFHFAFTPSIPLWFGNNIMFTLMMGVCMMMLLDRVSTKWMDLPLVLVFMIATFYSDWQFFGVPIIYVFYRFRQSVQKYWIIVVTSFLMMLLYLVDFAGYLQYPIAWSYIGSSLGILLVLPLLRNYNGQRGYSPNWVKWGFYAFYPLHLCLLWGIRFLILGH